MFADENTFGEEYISDIQLKSAAKVLKKIGEIQEQIQNSYEIIQAAVKDDNDKFVVLDFKELKNTHLTVHGHLFLYADQALVTNNQIRTVQIHITNRRR